MTLLQFASALIDDIKIVVSSEESSLVTIIAFYSNGYDALDDDLLAREIKSFSISSKTISIVLKKIEEPEPTPEPDPTPETNADTNTDNN